MFQRLLKLAAPTGWVGWCIQACVLMAVWNAPTPFVHFHKASAEKTVEWDLARHLARYHSVEDNCRRWHLHLLVPSNDLGDSDCPVPKDNPVRVGVGVGLPAGNCEVLELTDLGSEDDLLQPAENLISGLVGLESILSARPSQCSSSPFLSSYTGRVAIRDVLSVSLC